MRRFLAAGGTALACKLFDGFRVKAIALASLLLILATGSFSQSAFAQSKCDCWRNSKTGKAVRSYPFGSEPDSIDPNRAFRSSTGDNFFRVVPCPPPAARAIEPKTTKEVAVRLSDPIRTPVPESGGAGEVATGVAKGLVGGLLGGLFGGGGRESDGPSLPLRPPYPEQTFTSKDGKTKVNLSGATDPDACQIVVGGIESPGNGAPHLVVLQDNKGNVLQPTGITVYQIWEVWGGWRMTVSWTKSYFEDGRLVKQERGGWTASWTEFLGRFKNPGEIPAIWRDFGGKPFEGIRGVIADFKFPEGQTFNPTDWNLVAHVTTKDADMIVTQPFVASMTAGEKGILSFTQRETTVWEAATMP